MSGTTSWSRRHFLRVSAAAGGGLLLELTWPAGLAGAAGSEGAGGHSLNSFVKIDSTGEVTILAPVPEIGQGARTALPMIVAEELDVEWEAVTVLQAPAGREFGSMTVGGSDTVADYWEPLRSAGATARAMLIAAAAEEWEVEASACTAARGTVTHAPSGRSAGYGELAEAASRLPVPRKVPLKRPEEFRIIGTRIPRVDVPEIVTGQAKYGIDVQVPGMLYAVLERCPVEGGRVLEFDSGEALVVPGVRKIVEIQPQLVGGERYGAVRGGVAVVAENQWAAIQGRKALKVVWDEGLNREGSSEKLSQELESQSRQPGQTVLRDEGDARSAWESAATKLQGWYELPILAHACLEPMGFTAHVRPDGCDAWGPTQTPRSLQEMLAAVLRLPLSAVRVHPTLEGGGFGRRLAYDYGVEAAMVSQAAGAPVQVLWTREDDLRHDYYRTPSFHRLQAGLDESGRLVSWRHHFLTSPLRTHISTGKSDAPELYDVEGAVNLPYAIENLRVEYTPVKLGLQLGSWRSVSHSFNVFAVNCFLDEIAAAAGADPLELHLGLLGEPRQVELSLPLPGRRGRPSWDTGLLAAVLKAAAEQADWGDELPPRHGRGIACCSFKQTYVAHVAEVSVDEAGHAKVLRVVAAIDCGRVVNPDGVEAQVEGSVMDGVATVMKWRITLENGRVQQSNFHDYPLLRMSEAPRVEVRILPSERPPSGTGEPPYPSVAPAIANALFAATGKRVRRLPVRPADLASG